VITLSIDPDEFAGALHGQDAPSPGTYALNRRYLYPVTLPAGRHVLRFTTKVRRRTGTDVEFECPVAGDVGLATLEGAFMNCIHFERPARDARATGATVSLGADLPPASDNPRVIVNQNGRWLLFPPASPAK
jgi:hypothetical protein